jgi:RNA polymerase sigma-70 factor (ECF subfamily)
MATERQCAVVLDLFESSFERVYRFARRSVDAELAEEIAQEVFVRLLSLQDFEKKQLSVSYLIKIADNLLKRRHQRRRGWENIKGDLARDSVARSGAKAARPHSEIDDTRVTAAMDRLSSDERAAVRLIVCEGLSYEDAARSLGVQVSTINNWKHRGIQKLKDHIGPDEGLCSGPAGRAIARRGELGESAVPEQAARPHGGPEGDQ